MQGSAKNVIHYSKPEKLDFSVVESILRATSGSRGPVC